jgi:hypothetical protein
MAYNSRNNETLESFIIYCAEHPQLRFWQALASWAGYSFIFASDTGPHDLNTFSIDDLTNTYYWEGRTFDEGRIK